jgi:DNA-binding NarL/FixJ family response regulator
MKTETSCQTIEACVKPPLRVALVEDQPEIRKNWQRLIESFRDFEFVCACASAEEALQAVPSAQPDVVLMDIYLPRMSGIECTARLKPLLPKLRIVILTAVDDEEMVFLALEAGADGYLLKRTKPDDLRTALLEVSTGGVPMSSEIARRVVESFRRRAHACDDGTRLSTREHEVLELLSAGYSNKEISDCLKLSVDTVRSHLRHIFEKMHLRSRPKPAGPYVAGKPSTPAAGGLQIA